MTAGSLCIGASFSVTLPLLDVINPLPNCPPAPPLSTFGTQSMVAAWPWAILWSIPAAPLGLAYSDRKVILSFALIHNESDKGRCKKKPNLFRTLSQTMGRWGSKVLNFLVKKAIQLFLLQTSRNVLKHILHKWGGHIWPFRDDLRPQKISTLTH